MNLIAPANKLSIILLLILTFCSCSPETYSEQHKYANEYYYLDTNNLDSIYKFTPDYGKAVYKNDSINLAEFDKIYNDIIEISNDTLKLYTFGDYFSYGGDKTNDQNWQDCEYGHYLKMLNPVPGKHLLSISIQNY